jgi:hypothetical protein
LITIPIGTPSALHVTGAASADIRVSDTDLSRAKRPVDVDPSVNSEVVHLPAVNR